MRSILRVGCWAVACGVLGLAARADNYENYYANESAGEATVAESPDEGGLLLSDPPSGTCGCCCDCDCYDCCDCFNGRQRLLGFLPSDHCFDSFISPLSNPFYFEDPRSLTEVRGIFIDNSLPSFINGGDAQVWAAQLRGRVTDRVSFIAPRIGYLQVNQSGGGAPSGFMASPIGFKYNFLRDVDRQLLASAGITYFIPGSADAFSNLGDGSFNFYLSVGKEIFDYGHWLSGMGFRIPVDSNWGTQMWYWSNQWDYQIFDGVYALGGVNWFHWMRSAGVNVGAPVTGLDLIDIPISGVAGKNVVTGVAGVKLKPSSHCEIGTGFEFPLTERTDILKNRLYVDLIFRY